MFFKAADIAVAKEKKNNVKKEASKDIREV